MTQLETGPAPAKAESPVIRLRRSRGDRVIAGVCGGLGRYFGIDPVWFRLAFVALAIAGGSGVLIYLIAWLVIPEAAGDETPESRDGGRGSTGPIVIGFGLVILGLMLLVDNLFPWFERVMWPLLVVAMGVGIIYLGSRHERN